MGEEATADVRCLRLAASQHGLLRREQALQAGMRPDPIAWRLAGGRWERVLPGTYRVEGSPRTWTQQLKAACLWAGRGVAVSHRAAAALWKLARFPEGPVEVSVTRHLCPPLSITLHQVKDLRPSELGSVAGLPVTSPTRTLIDLSSITEFATLRASFDECLRRRLTSLDRLALACERARGQRGLATLRALVVRYQGGEAPTESELEALFLKVLEWSEVPVPEKQRCVVVRGRVRRLDFAYPDRRVAIEVDGYASHCDPISFEKDRERRNALTARGWKVLHFTWTALKDRPDEVIADLERTLAASPARPR